MRREILALILVIVAVVIAVIPLMLPGAGQGYKTGHGPAGNGYATAVSNSTPATTIPGDTTPVAFRAPAIPVPETMAVYRVADWPDAEEARAIMRGLGFSGEIAEGSGTFSSADDPDDFFINRSSDVLYYNNNINGDRPVPEDRYELLPADDEAVRIAGEFLAARGLWPEDAVFREVHLRLNEITMARNGTIISGNGLKQVEFARVMNGTPVFGDIIRVDIGANGEVVRVFRRWRAVGPVGIVPVISVSNAYEELAARGILAGPGNMSPGSVDLVQLGYAEENPGYLVPVYAIFGTWTVGNETRAFSEIVPAALVPG